MSTLMTDASWGRQSRPRRTIDDTINFKSIRVDDDVGLRKIIVAEHILFGGRNPSDPRFIAL